MLPGPARARARLIRPAARENIVRAASRTPQGYPRRAYGGDPRHIAMEQLQRPSPFHPALRAARSVLSGGSASFLMERRLNSLLLSGDLFPSDRSLTASDWLHSPYPVKIGSEIARRGNQGPRAAAPLKRFDIGGGDSDRARERNVLGKNALLSSTDISSWSGGCVQPETAKMSGRRSSTCEGSPAAAAASWRAASLPSSIFSEGDRWQHFSSERRSAV